jgi:hypothetical protein
MSTRKTAAHPRAGSQVIAVAAIIALALVGCAQPAASHRENKPPTASVASSGQQPDLLICRIRQEDKVFDDVLAFRIPVHDDKHGPPPDCHAMVEAEQSALNSTKTIPILDLGFFYLGGAAQWMLAHPDVHQCVQKVDAPNFVLSRFLGRADGTQGPTTVLVRNCANHLFFVTNADVSTGTAICGQAHIPECPTAAR